MAGSLVMQIMVISLLALIGVTEARNDKCTDVGVDKLQPDNAGDLSDLVIRRGCKGRYERFKEVQTQLDFEEGQDKLFPPNRKSLGPDGICDDTARIIQEDCAKLDHWESMETISEAMGKEFIIQGTGVKETDVRQGALGNCYFVAAISAIARRRPEIIENMILSKPSDKVIKSRWLVNGEDTIVKVDKLIPSSEASLAKGGWLGWSTITIAPAPHFAQVDWSTGVWWPVILEKAWAKIFGGYEMIDAETTDGGSFGIAAAAITGAPVVGLEPDGDNEQLWEDLLHAVNQEWVIGFSTNDNAPKYGLVFPHAYSVLDAALIEVSGEMKKALVVRNPWNNNTYKGSVPNSQSGSGNGTFTMLFEEASDCGYIFHICKAEKDYQVIATDLGAFSGAETYKVRTDKWWSVSVVWPNWRMLCEGPNAAPPAYVIAVKNVISGQVFLPNDVRRITPGANRISVEVPGTTNGEEAEYEIAFSVHFPAERNIRRIMLNMYHHNDAILQKQQGHGGKAYPEAILDILAGLGDACKSKAVYETSHDVDWQKGNFVDGVPVLKSTLGNYIMVWDYMHVKWVCQHR